MAKSKKTPRPEIPIPWYEDGFIPDHSDCLSVNDYLSYTPKDIYSMISKRVLLQDDAVKKLSVSVYNHIHQHRFISLIVGQSGSGKTYLMQVLKELFPDLICIHDVSSLSQDGWSGRFKSYDLFSAINSMYIPGTNISRIICCDEFDKTVTPKFSSGHSNVSEHVQGELLSIVSGTEINPNKDSDLILDTSKFSFIFLGAFEKQQSIKSSESSGIGFGSKIERTEAYSEKITMSDIHAAGCINELCGRIGSIIQLNLLPAESYRQMLDTHESGPIRDLEEEFGIRFHISDVAKDEICHRAWQSKLGVRSIKNELRSYIDEMTWETGGKLKDIEIG